MNQQSVSQSPGAESLRGDELLQLPPEGDLGAVLADGAVVHQQEVGVVLVQADEPRPGRERERERAGKEGRKTSMMMVMEERKEKVNVLRTVG